MDLGPYRVVGELGRGGVGVVYRALSPDGRQVALKVLKSKDADRAARFERERRLHAALGMEEGFVPLLDAVRTDRGLVLAMPLLAGGTLRDRLTRGPLGVEETVALGRALAAAAGRAHALGVVHRDLKPENVLFTAEGRPLLADLGLAKHFDAEAPGASQSVSLSRSGFLRGTAGYMAPEQIQDARSVGPGADVFSLGAILYECLAGQPAFEGESMLAVLSRVTEGRTEPLRALRSDVPDWLAATIDKALATRPEERHADGEALARALEAPTKAPRRGARAGVALLVLGALASAFVAYRVVTRPAGASAPRVLVVERPRGGDEKLPPGLRRTGRKVGAAGGGAVDLYLYGLPDGSEMEMVHVPPGDFVMGSDDADAFPAEKPRHVHRLDHGFWIGRCDVTRKQYGELCRRIGHSEPPPASFDAKLLDAERHPVVNVSWDDARDYAAWARLSLPSEAEWERAARGTDGRRYPWGDDWDPGRRCNFADADCPVDTIDVDGGKKLLDIFQQFGLEWDREHHDGHAFTSPAGSFPEGASPCGALDIVGDVLQWTEDWYDASSHQRYKDGDTAPPKDSSVRAYRGGSWCNPARNCRSYFRAWYAPSYRSDFLGFRVVLRSGP